MTILTEELVEHVLAHYGEVPRTSEESADRRVLYRVLHRLMIDTVKIIEKEHA